MEKKFYQAGLLRVNLSDRVLLLIAPERPASHRSKHAFDEQTWQPVEPPEQGYRNGAIGCQEVIVVRRSANVTTVP